MKSIIIGIMTYWQEIIIGVINALFARVMTKLRKEREMRQCLKNAICALLRDRIIGIYNRYSEKEYFPIHERENLSHLTEQYYLLGGNGVIRELEAKLASLPTVNSEHENTNTISEIVK